MVKFLDWATEEKYYNFVHKYKRGDQGKYNRKLSVTREEVLSVTSFSVPKETVLTDKNGKQRIVYTLPRVESMYCSFYCEYLSEVYSHEIHSSVVSYKKGISVGKVCRKLSKNIEGNSFTKIDIRKYFDSVCKDKLLDLLMKLNLPEPLVSLFMGEKVMTVEGVEEKRFLGMIQGNPLSSFFANALLFDFDVRMSTKHKVYFRYSDDMLFSDENETDLEEVCAELATFGLQVNESKTNHYVGEIEFLGLLIEQGRVRASEKYMLQFKSQIKLKGIEKKKRNVNSYIHRIVNDLAGSWIFTTMFGCRLEYLFGAVTSSHQFFELDNLIFSNIQYLLTGSRNTNVACRRGITFKYIKDKFEFSLEKAFNFYKESEILSRAFLLAFTREAVSEIPEIRLTEILNSSSKEFFASIERLVYYKNGEAVNISWGSVYDDSGFITEPDLIAPYVEGLAVPNARGKTVALGKVSRLERHLRFDLDYDYKMFLAVVAVNSLESDNGFKVLKDTSGSYIAAKYERILN
jgi:hypothetical protein